MKTVVRSAALMGLSSILVIFFNFLLQIYLAFRFGAGKDMDAYVGAMTIPTLLTSVINPGINIVLIPIFVQSVTLRGSAHAWRGASTFINIAAFTLTIMTALLVLFATPLMHATVPGLEPATMALAISLVRWLLVSTLIGMLAATVSALDQARERFHAAALSPAIGAAFLVGVTAGLAPTHGIHALAFAMVVSSAVQLAVVLPVLRGGYTAVFDLGDQDVRRIAYLLLPLVAGGLFSRATVVADRMVASLLPNGTLSHLEYASRIAAVISTLFTSGIAAAAYPRMSKHAARGSFSSLYDALVLGQRLLMMFLFPALAVGVVLRVDLLQLVLERGRFSRADTLAVAAIVLWFLIGVIGGALGVLQARIYYVLQDTWTPVLLGIIETAAYFVYLPFLASSRGAVGVGMANAIYLISALIVNGIVVLRKLHAHRMFELPLAAARLGAFAAIAAAIAGLVRNRIADIPLRIAAASLVGAAIYFVLLVCTRADEIRLFRALLRHDKTIDAT